MSACRAARTASGPQSRVPATAVTRSATSRCSITVASTNRCPEPACSQEFEHDRRSDVVGEIPGDPDAWPRQLSDAVQIEGKEVRGDDGHVIRHVAPQVRHQLAVDFDGDDVSGARRQLGGQRAPTRAHLQKRLGWLRRHNVDNAIDPRRFEEVLREAALGLDDHADSGRPDSRGPLAGPARER